MSRGVHSSFLSAPIRMSSLKELIYNNLLTALQPSDGLPDAKADEPDRQSSATRNEHEDKKNVVDVVELCKTIDHSLAIWDANLTVSKSEKDASKPTFRKFAKDVSKKIKNVFHKIADPSEGILDIAGDVLNSLVGVPWFGVGFVLLGTILKRVHKAKEIEGKQRETIKENGRECFKIVKSMHELAKIMMDLQHLPYKSENMLMAIAESIEKIITGVRSCHVIIEDDRKKMADANRRELTELRQQLHDMRYTLHVYISLSAFELVCHYTRPLREGSLGQLEYPRSHEGRVVQLDSTPPHEGISQRDNVFKRSSPRINLKQQFDDAVGDGLKKEDASRKRKRGMVQKIKKKVLKGGRK